MDYIPEDHLEKMGAKITPYGMVRDLEIYIMTQDAKLLRTLLRTPGGEWVPLTSEETEELTVMLHDITEAYEDFEVEEDGDK